MTIGPIEHGLAEVYPHPALVEMMAAPKRLLYKFAKIRSYWPADGAETRRDHLRNVWQTIVAQLDENVAGKQTCCRSPTPMPTPGR
ncbi:MULTISPECIES: hypothetical protein [Agrobacterium tumefaciens complex]|uniref:Uncharacterized protein n=1 Tax=Agrobacterium tomkonis CFBP 6623 TaxID=1183432 RepID=A0A1S7S3A6_9HYPH|nr:MULTISPECIES: hypothetical protein [Agrobacterium tumefaciens complex]CUX61712.1 conserved hypothetical protein [Agrobacterium tomkonis CFBP 6623]